MVIAEVHLYTKLLVQIVPNLKPSCSFCKFKSHMEMTQIHFINAFTIVAMSLNANYPLYNSNSTASPGLYNCRGKSFSGGKLRHVSTTICQHKPSFAHFVMIPYLQLHSVQNLVMCISYYHNCITIMITFLFQKVKYYFLQHLPTTQSSKKTDDSKRNLQ